jgi:hydrogenase maturation protease
MSGPFDQQGAPRKILVVGLGNPDRGDDAVGAIVAQKLAGRLPADVALLVRGSDMLSLIEDWAGFDALVCVDAAVPMGAPGRIHRVDLTTDELPRNMSFTSCHAFGLVDAIRLARTLQRAPQAIIVYAVEGCCFDGGAPVTAAVAVAAREVTRRVIAEVGHLRQSGMEALPHGIYE